MFWALESGRGFSLYFSLQLQQLGGLEEQASSLSRAPALPPFAFLTSKASDWILEA